MTAIACVEAVRTIRRTKFAHETLGPKSKNGRNRDTRLQGMAISVRRRATAVGGVQATVRYKAPPSEQLRTLMLDSENFDTAGRAQARAKELAVKWADDRSGDGRGET
jgi:hypothetical protein